ncbi:MAG: protein TolQ [Rhodobacteraceae bacterium]|nr:protein TolQ [Paracoccaceae bacterium]MCY4195371.1 protein TolQ [Paracoccaceae bacterium]MCY4327596.1 protein TolQ [Paracoccaceae bacterium]
METETITPQHGADFSLVGLFFEAGLVVQLVMLLLLLASFWTWAIIFQKYFNFRKVRRDAQEFDRKFWSGQPLDELYSTMAQNPKGASERIFCAAMDEWKKSQRTDGILIAGVRSRIDRSMGLASSRETGRLVQGLGFLATVGSTAPFVGLFGTVWGIMRVFSEIGLQETTSLIVVAPGIGEALAATALGLLAAIPAVIFYNSLSGAAERLADNFENFSEEFSTIISRQLDD